MCRLQSWALLFTRCFSAGPLGTDQLALTCHYYKAWESIFLDRSRVISDLQIPAKHSSPEMQHLNRFKPERWGAVSQKTPAYQSHLVQLAHVDLASGDFARNPLETDRNAM